MINASILTCNFVVETTSKILQTYMKHKMATNLVGWINNYLRYDWSQKLKEMLQHRASCPTMFSILLMPQYIPRHNFTCKDVEDTTTRAMAWFAAAQASGVPIIFVGVQTELLFDKVRHHFLAHHF